MCWNKRGIFHYCQYSTDGKIVYVNIAWIFIWCQYFPRKRNMRSFRRSSGAIRNTGNSPISSSSTNRVTNGLDGSDTNDVSSLHSDPIATKHISISYAASDPTLVYESVVLFFSLSAFFLQLLHLYRTVWWLPQSYTQYAVVN